MGCAPSTVSPQRPCKFEPIAYGPYIHSKNRQFQEYNRDI